MKELMPVKFLAQIVVGIDKATKRNGRRREDFQTVAAKADAALERRPRIERLYEKLRVAELELGSGGKGRNVWTCFGAC
jgi:hypothetical protein